MRSSMRRSRPLCAASPATGQGGPTRLFRCRVQGLGFKVTHRLLGSSFLGLPCRILFLVPKKELLRSLWVGCYSESTCWGFLRYCCAEICRDFALLVPLSPLRRRGYLPLQPCRIPPLALNPKRENQHRAFHIVTVVASRFRVLGLRM